MRHSSRSKWAAFFGSRWFLLGGIVLFLLLSLTFGRAYYRNYLIQQEIARLQSEVARIKGKRLETLNWLQRVTSPAFVEEKARRELNLQKEGEQVMIIDTPRPGPEQRRLPSQTVVESDNVSNPVRWWRYFFE